MADRTFAALLVLSLVAALVAAAAPLAIYAATLALFGFTHVVVELRYVRARFGARIDARLARTWIALLLLLALLRAADFARLAIPGGRTNVELALLGALLLVTALFARGARRIVAVAVTAAAGLLFLTLHPATVLVTLAFLHNLTPLGFLFERVRGPERPRVLALAGVAFFVVPALIVAGAFEPIVGFIPYVHSGWALDGVVSGAFSGIGEAADHFGVYLPGSLQESALAPRLFAAAVYLQCAHYFVVIEVLPRLLPAMARAARPPFKVVAPLVAVGLALVVLFLCSFTEARALYGIAAAVHAFLEWPLFLALVGGLAQPERLAQPAAAARTAAAAAAP